MNNELGYDNKGIKKKSSEISGIRSSMPFLTASLNYQTGTAKTFGIRNSGINVGMQAQC